MNRLLKIIFFGALLLLLSNGKALALSAPSAPDNLEAETYSSSRINLTWDDNSSNETGFYIYRKTGSSGTYSQIATVSANTESYKDTSVHSDTKYYYVVCAYNSSGYSSLSNEDYATTDDDSSSSDLDAPDNLEAETYSSSRINLTWDDNSSGETKFYIYRKTGSSGTYTKIASVSANTESYKDTDLEEDTKYYYKVCAYDGDDYSDYSNEDYATTDEDDDSHGDLDAPDNLKAEAYSHSRIDLTWDDNSSDETRFYIYRKTGSSGSYSQIASVSSNTEEYSDTDVDSDTKYYYKVCAYDGSSYSDYSNEDYVTADDDNSDSDLDAPDNLKLEVISSSKIELTWDDNSSGETKFYISRKKGSSGSYSQIASVSSNTEEYKDSDLQADTKYYYKVRAYDGDDYSDFSDEEYATTDEGDDSDSDIEAPSYLTANQSNGSVRLTWTDNADNEAAYVVERRTGSGSFNELNWLGPNVTSYNDSTAAGSSNYSYRVRAYNSGGYSDYSNTATLQTSLPTSSPTSSPSTSNQSKQLRFSTGSRVYYCNGQQYNMDAAPINVSSRVMIPIRYVTDQIGANVVWDAKAKKVTITYNGKTIELWAGKRTAKVNTVSKYIDTSNTQVTPVIVSPGRLMVPLRFVTENLGCQVTWEAATNTAVITLP